MKVTLFCPEPTGLKLGPSITPGEYIQFKDGWASFDDQDFPDWEKWVAYKDTPPIEVIPSDSGEVAPTSAEAHVCPVCGKAFSAEIAKLGHMRSHAPKE